MKTSCAGAIRGLWDELNQGLFPWIDDNIGELDARHRLFMAVCEAVIRPREFDYAKWKGNGRPPASRLKIFKAFLLKAVLNVKDTKELVRMLRAEPLSRRLCGWDSPGLVPSETRFCCVFGEFAERGFTDEWFAEMIVKYHGDIPAETVSYDSAPVEVRSRAANANGRSTGTAARRSGSSATCSNRTAEGPCASARPRRSRSICCWGQSSSPSSRCSAWSADGACPEMGEDTDGDGVERPYRPPPHCLKTLPAPTRHERWRNRSARLPSNDLPAPAYRGFEITSTVNQPPS